MARAKASDAWRNRDLVVTVGGKADPRWYFAEDLDQLARAEEWSSRGWPYRNTGEVMAHPSVDAAGVIHRRIRR